MWAIGLNKGWVEVRSGLSAPIPNRSKVVRAGKNGGQELVLEAVFWEGGRVVSIIPRNKYLQIAKGLAEEAPKTGGIKELGAVAKKSFSSKAWRKELGIDNGQGVH